MKIKSIQLGAACVLLANVVFLPSKGFADAPSITTQPQSQGLLAGTNAIFSVVASGQATLLYQWSLNGTNLANSAHISGATNAMLTVRNLEASDAGDFQVTVSNSHGSVTSSNATLTVLFPPVITNQPINQAVILTSNATFSAQASGTTPLSFQWQRAGVNLVNSASVSGANSNVLNLSGALTNDAGSYQLVVTNSFGAVTSAVAVLTVDLPIVSIDNSTLLEGDAGTNAMIFLVHLSAPIGVTASVGYLTYSGSATSGEDFDGAAGTLVFSPGETNQTLTIWIHGDNKYETDEIFPVNLNNPLNVKLVNHQGTGTILNDDPLPEISVQPTAWPEGNIRSSNRTFTVTLSRPSQLPVNVAYQTEDQSAIGGSDYISTNGIISFNGTTNVDVPILIKGDLDVEPDEFFAIELSDPTNGTIAVAQGVGTILNDDGISGYVHHFEITTLSGASARLPDVVTVTALDIFNQPATNFAGSVLLMAGLSNLPAIHLDFEEGDFSVWSPLNSGNQPGPYEILPFDIAGSGITSLAFRIAPNPGLDGIVTSQSIGRVGRYFISVLMAQAMGSPGNGDGATARIAVDGVQIITNTFGLVYYSNPLRTQLYAICDIATTNTPHTFSLLFDRIWYPVNPYSGLGIYSDDFVVSPAPLPSTRTTTFTNGVWTGPVIFRDAVTNVLLFADDDERHRGSSKPFNVQQSLDVAVGIGHSPAVPRVGTFSLNLVVTNLGPRGATAVVVTNFLPTGLTFVSASTTNGSCINSGTNVLWLVGSLASGQVANATVVVSATDTNSFSPSAIASVVEPDFNLLNNTSTTTFTPAVPSLSTVNMSASEQVGGSVMTFPVTLSAPFDHKVSVQFSTMWSPFAGTFSGDIISTNGVLVFPPGVTEQDVSVVIVDDLIYEGTEHFTFELTYTTTAVVGDGTHYLSWSATLYDNEPPPTLAISDCTIVEGDAGTTNAVFTVTLVGATALNTTVNFATASGTASAGSDFIATNGTLTFLPGTNSLQIVVPVKGNTVSEGDEMFHVNLSSPGNATLADAQGIGTILNDDAVPNRLDHFEWVWEISSPQIKNRFVPAALIARDAFGQVIFDFQGTVTLSAMASNGLTNLGITPNTISNFQNGAWADYLLFTNTGNQVVLRADDGDEHIGFSNPFDVLAYYPTTVRLPTGITEGDGPPTVSGAVGCIVPNNVDAWFTLTVNNPSLLSVPGTVMLPAGQTNVPFDMQFSDDALLNGTRTVSVTATPTTTGYATNTASVQVYDNEFAVLGVNLPASVAEKSSPLAGTVTLSAPPDTNIEITLTSSDTTELTVPASVTLPAGQTSAGFTAYAADDNLLDGTQSATVTAHVQNWHDGMATLAVIDNETNKFTVSYWFQGPFTEGMGTISNALRLTVGGVLLSNLTVNLASSDTTEMIVPATVTIGAGSNNTLFNVTVVDDTETDGTQPATVTASLPDFTSGSLTFNVADSDLHHFTFSTFASVQTSDVPFTVAVTAKDVNNVILTRYTNSPVFTASGFGGLLPFTLTGFNGTGILRGTFSGTIAVSAPLPQTVTLHASDGLGHDSFSSPFELQYPTWAGTPQIDQVQILGPDVVLSFPSVASAQYFLEMATILPPVWQQVGLGVIGNGSILTLTNTGGGTDKTRFFRLLVQPKP